jgi:hypothetical protein
MRIKASFVFEKVPTQEDLASQHLLTTEERQTETIRSKLQRGVLDFFLPEAKHNASPNAEIPRRRPPQQSRRTEN